MKIVFRTDASVQIGTGHVMRCLTLADALRNEGTNCTFVCRPHVGHLLDLIRQRGHKVVELSTRHTSLPSRQGASPQHAAWLGTDWATDATETQQAISKQPVDWLVVDHYALDHHWEKAMRPHCQQLMVIDDLADRVHHCDLLLDQNLGRSAEDYSELLPHTSTTLIGPRYALLRPEFKAFREESLARRTAPQLKHLLITMGGVDKDNATGLVLAALRSCTLPSDMRITVVMGAQAPWLDEVRATAAAMQRPTQVLVSVNDMARLMTDSDLVIGAGGGTAWERCCLGLPSLVIAMAENQRAGALALQKNGAAFMFESNTDILSLIQNPLLSGEAPTLLKELSSAAATVTQGNGAYLVLKELGKPYV